MRKPLFWHQGLFLQPQHFQLSDLHTQSLLTPYQQFLQPYFWGVAEMEIAESGLGNFTFNLNKGEFLFPDMAYAVLHQNAILEARTFDESWVEGGKPFTIYLGLKKMVETAENVSVISSGESPAKINSRYIAYSEPEDIMDLHQGGPEAQVKQMVFNLKIFWETEVDKVGDYEVIPIARLERSGDDIKLSERFSPPLLKISGSSTILKLVKEVRDQITARAHQLEQYKRDRGIHSAEFGTRDLVFLMALRSLSRYVPLLYHYTEAAVHPWMVYGTIRQLAGELASFSDSINVLGEEEIGGKLLLEYRHRNLYECFAGSLALITRLLDEITAGPEYMMPLTFDGTYFATDLSPAIFEGRNRFFLVMESEEDEKDIIQAIEGLAKISSREHLPILIARALPGVRCENLPVPPQELPRRTHAVYFQLDHHGDQWADVQKGNNIALYWDSAPEDLKVELMVVERT